MFKQCLHMENYFSKLTTYKQSRKPDRKPYYPYGFRNLYKQSINEVCS